MTTIDEFLSTYSAEVAEISGELRQFVRKIAPNAQERLQPGWKCITYSHEKAFCSILPHSKWVNLQFQAGSELPDPQSRLGGTGKSMRHVRVTSTADLDDALAEIVTQAARLAK